MIGRAAGGLRFDAVSKARGGRAALDGVSLVVEEGKITCLLGPSGAGKSTLLRLAIRLDDPDEGRILLDGEDIRGLPVADLRRRVGYLSQIPVMFEGSVEENARYAMDLARTSGEGPKGRIEEALPLVGLDPSFLPRAAKGLSVGEQARVALLRAVVRDPEVLLLDEPTSALDPRTAERVAATISDLARARRVTTLYVTHDHDLARAIGDRIVEMREGRIA